MMTQQDREEMEKAFDKYIQDTYRPTPGYPQRTTYDGKPIPNCDRVTYDTSHSAFEAAWEIKCWAEFQARLDVPTLTRMAEVSPAAKPYPGPCRECGWGTEGSPGCNHKRSCSLWIDF